MFSLNKSIGKKVDNKVYYENEIYPRQKTTLREKFKQQAYHEKYYFKLWSRRC